MRKIAHLSDLHFGRVDTQLLEPLRRRLEALAPDLIVVSGDLTQRAKIGQFREAKAWLDTLPTPQLIVPGNHDVPLYNVFMRFVRPFARYRKVVDPNLEPSFIDSEIAVVGVNTARSMVFKGGRINEEQVARVKALLCTLPEDVTKILVTHHPFDVPAGTEESGHLVGRAQKALEALAGCGADVFLAGHLHATHVGHTADRYPVAGISALVVQAGTATSTRARGETNSFNLLRVSARHIAVDRYAWQDGDFTATDTESFHHTGDGWSLGDGPL